MAAHYVTSAGAGSGTGADVANAWTFQQAFDAQTSAVGGRSVVNGDVVYVCADATYTPTSTLTPSANVRTTFIGANSSGVVDGTVPVISGVSIGTPGSNPILNLNNTAQRFIGLDFNGASTVANCITCSYQQASFHNCIVRNATSYGADVTAQRVLFRRCEIYGNGGGGVNGNFDIMFLDCSVHDNTGTGLVMKYAGLVGGCVFYDNTTDIVCNENTNIFDCTFGGSTTGINTNTLGNSTAAFDCVFANCTTGWDSSHPTLAYRCYFESNTTDSDPAVVTVYTLASGTIAFTSTTDGSEDYTPGTSAPVVDAGTPLPYKANGDTNSTIGAIHPDPAASGGGGSPLQSPFIRV